MKLSTTTLLAMAVVLAACDGSSRRPAANTAPTISNIADQSMTANRPTDPIGFSVADDQTGALQISATSDNESVVPNSGISIAGSGTSRSLTVTPTPDTAGDAMISIVVTDQAGLMTGSSFLLTINPEQRSMQQFTRDEFAAGADDEPFLINAVEFDQDADTDDFADLLAP